MQAANRLNLPLARVPLFRGLDDATIDDILSCMQGRRYAAGELICRQGEPSDSLFLLRSGVAQAFVTSLRSSTVTTIARLRPGDLIGEVGVVTNLPRSASVIAAAGFCRERTHSMKLRVCRSVRSSAAASLRGIRGCWRTSRK